MWSINNGLRIHKKPGYKKPYITFSSTNGLSNIISPDGSYNVYTYTNSTTCTATIYNPVETTINFLLIGRGGGSWSYQGSGGGGAGGYREFALVIPGSSTTKTINFTSVGNPSSIVFNGITYSIGQGGQGGQTGSGSAASPNSGGSGGGSSGATNGTSFSGGAGNTFNGIAGNRGGGNSGTRGGGGGGGAGGIGQNGTSTIGGAGGTGKSPTLPGLVEVYGTTVYCVGGQGGTTNGGIGSGAATYGSGRGGGIGNNIGIAGAIIFAVNLNDIPL
jgi:hypothetical protein